MTAKDRMDAENMEIDIHYSKTVDYGLIQGLSSEIENQLNTPGKTHLIPQSSTDILLRNASTSAAKVPFTSPNLVTVPEIITIVIGVASLLLLLGNSYVNTRIKERAKIDAQNANERRKQRKQKSTPFVRKLSVLKQADVSVSIDIRMEQERIGIIPLEKKTEEAIEDELYVFLRDILANRNDDE